MIAWDGLRSGVPALSYVHVDHLGAPVAVTDEHAQAVWAAQYTPFGQRLRAPDRPMKTRAAARRTK